MPLMWAMQNGHMPVVRFLVEAGADVSAEDNDGSTALDNATKKGHGAVAALLRGSRHQSRSGNLRLVVYLSGDGGRGGRECALDGLAVARLTMSILSSTFCMITLY